MPGNGRRGNSGIRVVWFDCAGQDGLVLLSLLVRQEDLVFSSEWTCLRAAWEALFLFQGKPEAGVGAITDWGGMRDANNARCQMMVMGEGVRGAFEGKSLSGRLPHAQLHCPFCPLAFVIMRCSFCPFVIADKPRVAVQREAVQRHKFSGIPDCVPRKCHGNSRS